MNAGMDRSRLLFKDVQARFNLRSGRFQCRFKLGSNFWRADQGLLRRTLLPYCQRQGGHGTHKLRRLSASSSRQDGMRDRCDYSGRSGFGGLRGRHFACGFSWSFSGCRVHRPRLSGRSIAIGIDALNADSAPCRADNTQTCRICRSLEAALPLPANLARLLTVRRHPTHTESQIPFSQAERRLLSCAKADTCNQCHVMHQEPPEPTDIRTLPPPPSNPTSTSSSSTPANLPTPTHSRPPKPRKSPPFLKPSTCPSRKKAARNRIPTPFTAHCHPAYQVSIITEDTPPLTKLCVSSVTYPPLARHIPAS